MFLEYKGNMITNADEFNAVMDISIRKIDFLRKQWGKNVGTPSKVLIEYVKDQETKYLLLWWDWSRSESVFSLWCDQVAEYNENILQQSSKIYKKNKYNTDLMCTVFLALCVLTVSSYKFR
mgnify:CR=1 FL=1